MDHSTLMLMTLASPPIPRRRRIGLLALVAMILAAGAAEAGGVTGFIQRASPNGRSGIGLGLSLPVFTEIISIEGEYSRASEEDRSPSLTIWSGNLLIVSPVSVLRLRLGRRLADLTNSPLLSPVGIRCPDGRVQPLA